MTPRSPALRPLAILLIAALIAPLAAFAQSAGSPAATGQAPGASQPAATPAPTAQPAAARASTVQTTPTQAAPSQAAPAQTYGGPAYDVEIVIFRNRATVGQAENWAAETTAGATVAGGEASSGSASVGKLLTVLPSSDYRLTAIASRLRTSGTYEPVAHAAWVQTASDWGTHTGFSLESLGINVPGLSGVIFLERGEFLHLGMALNYTMEDPPTGLNAPAGTTFVMNETRRIRFYQRNYYDHPAFGAIALVTPARGPRPPGR
ncbi:MAG TPA: CsiV family protein [Steroidobacteraceae bacterium]|nr:CsiV family protein [Steroidobacteraceae bacterium]